MRTPSQGCDRERGISPDEQPEVAVIPDAPRLFALFPVDLDDELALDVEASPGIPELASTTPAVRHADDAVAWGIEFPDRAVLVLGPDGLGGSGVFGSAERARRMFSRIEPLRLVWVSAE